MFAVLATKRRHIVPISRYIPKWLQPLPFGLRLRGRKAWWSIKALPISGWHIQQLAKLSAASLIEDPVSALVDSDVVFLRALDLQPWLGRERLPLFRRARGITSNMRNHVAWLETASHVLGIAAPPTPATDYIENIIVWDRENVRTLLERITHNSGLPWELALCRHRAFSEYLLYGYHVATDALAEVRHCWVEENICATDWSGKRLREIELKELTNSLKPTQVAVAIQSFSQTPIPLIREAANLTT